LKLAEKDNVNWKIAYAIAKTKIPRNITNELLLRILNKNIVSLYIKWIKEFKKYN